MRAARALTGGGWPRERGGYGHSNRIAIEFASGRTLSMTWSVWNCCCVSSRSLCVDVCRVLKSTATMYSFNYKVRHRVHEGQSKSGPCRSLFSSLMGSPAEGLRCAGVWLLVTGILGGMLLPSGPLCAPATTLSRSSNSLPQPSMETHPHRSATCLLSRGLYRRMHPRLLLERR